MSLLTNRFVVGLSSMALSAVFLATAIAPAISNSAASGGLA